MASHRNRNPGLKIMLYVQGELFYFWPCILLSIMFVPLVGFDICSAETAGWWVYGVAAICLFAVMAPRMLTNWIAFGVYALIVVLGVAIQKGGLFDLVGLLGRLLQHAPPYNPEFFTVAGPVALIIWVIVFAIWWLLFAVEMTPNSVQVGRNLADAKQIAGDWSMSVHWWRNIPKFIIGFGGGEIDLYRGGTVFLTIKNVPGMFAEGVELNTVKESRAVH